MGRTRHEISCVREDRDHPAGGAIASSGQAHTGQTRYPTCHLLSLVRSLSRGWHRSAGRPSVSTRPDLDRIPDGVRGQIIDLALELPELSPRELAVRFTDERKYFVSEASVYRLLKAHDREQTARMQLNELVLAEAVEPQVIPRAKIGDDVITGPMHR